MPTTGWVSPGTVSGWTNSSNATSSNNTYATATASGWLVNGPLFKASNFGLSLPTGATVTTIEVEIEGYYTVTNSVIPDNGIYDVIFLKNVASTPGSLSSPGWDNDRWGLTEAVRTASAAASSNSVDGSTMNTWTAAEINATSFGLIIEATGTSSNPTTGGDINYFLDNVRIRLTYDDPNDLGTYTNSNTSTHTYGFDNGVVANISYVGQATGTNTVTLPTHEPGDMVILFAFRDGNATPPTEPTGLGWETITTRAGTSCSARVSWRRARNTGTTAGSWTNATSVVALVYRGATGPGASNVNSGSSTTVNYPALSLSDAGGGAWVVGFAGHRSTNTNLQNAPSGMTNRANTQDATDEASGHDTNGPVTTWTSTNVAVGGTSSGWVSVVVEIWSTGTAHQTGSALFWSHT